VAIGGGVVDGAAPLAETDALDRQRHPPGATGSTDRTRVLRRKRLQLVVTWPRSVDAYVESAGPAAVAELRMLAAPLCGLRVLHVNATPSGGVAEILQSAVPLLCGLGLVASWRTIVAEPAFFAVTKAIHNGLRGAPRVLSPAARAIAAHGRERVHEEFLITRLLADELRLYADLLGRRTRDAAAAD
jgi:hypothetical protein